MEKETMWRRFLIWRFMRLGGKLFRVVMIWREPNPGEDEMYGDEPIKAVTFADSERSLNSSVRSHVEELDK